MEDKWLIEDDADRKRFLIALEDSLYHIESVSSCYRFQDDPLVLKTVECLKSVAKEVKQEMHFTKVRNCLVSVLSSVNNEVVLDEHGWAHVDELIATINKKHWITKLYLEHVVSKDKNECFSFNEDKTLIRINTKQIGVYNETH